MNIIMTKQETIILREDDVLDREIILFANLVYQAIGKGMRERVYHNAINILLTESHKTILEYPISIQYRGHCMSICYPDILLIIGEEKIIIEIKAISKIQLKEKLQLLGYMRHSGIRIGYLINFGLRELEVIKFNKKEETELTEVDF